MEQDHIIAALKNQLHLTEEDLHSTNNRLLGKMEEVEKYVQVIKDHYLIPKRFYTELYNKDEILIFKVKNLEEKKQFDITNLNKNKAIVIEEDTEEEDTEDKKDDKKDDKKNEQKKREMTNNQFEKPVINDKNKSVVNNNEKELYTRYISPPPQPIPYLTFAESYERPQLSQSSHGASHEYMEMD